MFYLICYALKTSSPGINATIQKLRRAPRPLPRMGESVGELSTKEITETRMTKQACTVSGRWPGCRQLSSGTL